MANVGDHLPLMTDTLNVILWFEKANFRKIRKSAHPRFDYNYAHYLPILGLLIWFVVGRGLSPLKNVAQEVSHRAQLF